MNTDQRLQLICAALSGLCANPSIMGPVSLKSDIACDAVDIADAVIERMEAEEGHGAGDPN